MVEAALVTTVFLYLLVAIMDFGRLGFAYNSITYAAHRAARFAATSGSASGHPTNQPGILANVQSNVVALDTSSPTMQVNVLWISNNNPGSQVQVTVSYAFQPLLIPVSANALTLTSTSTQYITQ
jgi:Flp pilus assembly protein TadG